METFDDALGANGNADAITPHLDRLAAEGLNFNRYFVQNPVCMPSRVSFLTGQYPSALNITHMGVPVPENTVTLPKMIKHAGYVTANIGKLHFLPHANRDHKEPHPDYGFDHLEISDEPGCYEDAYRAWVRRKAPEQLDLISVVLPRRRNLVPGLVGERRGETSGGTFSKAGAPVSRIRRGNAFRICSRANDEFEQHREQSWLCVAGFYSPHSPWVAPQRFLDLYDPAELNLPSFPPEVEAQRTGERLTDEELRAARHGYYAMISEVDEPVGGVSLYPALFGNVKVGRGAALMEQTLKNRSWKSIRTEHYRYIRESDGKESLFDIGRAHGEYVDVAGEPCLP